MKITCQSCQSKYNVADEKVQGKIVKIRCRKCGGTIVVNATGGAPSASANGSRSLEEISHASSVAPVAQSLPASGGQGEWHVNLGDNDQRQMSLADLVTAYNSGVVTPDTFIWTDGMDDWRPLGEVEPVVAALHAAQTEHGGASTRGAYEPPGPAAYEAASAPAEEAYEAPAAAPVATYAAQAAAPGPEARRAAVKREPRGRDLFSTQVGEDMQTSAAAAASLMGAPADDGKLTGQRNENSVLFSLAVLTKNADERAPGSAQAPSKDDSGMIDLKALVARAESARPAARVDGGDMFAPPLGLAPQAFANPIGPLGVHGTDGPGKSRLPLLIGAIGGIAVLLAAGVFIGVKLAPGATAAPPVASAAPSVSAVPAASTAEPPASAAQAEPSASPSASSATAAPAKPRSGGFGGGGGHASAGAKQPASTGASPPTPAAAALPPSPAPKKTGGGGDCGCNGDLMCMMKCSTH